MTRPFLIVGKSGQVSTALQACLRASETAFVVIDRDAVDLSTLDDKKAILDIINHHNGCAILNAAAHTAVDLAESEPDLAMAINGKAPGIMADACRDKNIPFVHVSTDFVFDGKATRPYTEDQPTAPLSVYGRTKLAGEEAVQQVGGASAILRTSWVFSETGKNFVKTMLRLGAERDMLTIVADQHGGPTPANAIAAAMITIAQSLSKSPEKRGIYHFSGIAPTSWAGFARAIMKQAKLGAEVTDITTDQFPTPATRPSYSVLDCSKIKETFGISQPDWKDGLTQTLKALDAASQPIR